MKLFNKRPIHYEYHGGRVKRVKRMTRKQLSSDSVRAILQPGEIVIPVKYAGRVTRLLKQRKIKLPGLK